MTEGEAARIINNAGVQIEAQGLKHIPLEPMARKEIH
jgi:hypothetical protein